jgi:hypothetical protein
MLMFIVFTFNLVFESSMSIGSGIMVFCDFSTVIENTKNEYFVFNPHSSRCTSGLGACHLSIHKSMVELCRL